MQQPNMPTDVETEIESLSVSRPAHFQTSARRRSTRRPQATANNLTHTSPQPFVDPIARVKRESIHWKRKLFHVIGIGTVALTYALTNVGQWEAFAILGVFALIFAGMDIARFYIPALNQKVRQDLGFLMRDYELKGLSGSTWFLVSAVLAIAAFPKPAVALGCLYLALGDPLASWAGLRWGKTRLPGGKSLEGSLTFFGVSAIAGLTMLSLNPAMTMAAGPMLVLVAGTALVAAIAEWLPAKGIDDNFIVPLAASGAGAALLALLA
jgi:diacylglycerol kinase (CTP)